MHKYISTQILQNLRSNVIKSLSTPSNTQVWLYGPEGRGKTTFVNELFKQLKNTNNQRYVTSYFDFYSVKDYNFQTSLFKYVDSLVQSVSKLTDLKNNTLKGIFEDLKSRFPKFDEHTHNYFNHIAQSNTNILTSNKRWRELVLSMNKSLNFDQCWNACLMTYELHPNSLGVSSKINFNSLQLFMILVNSIAHRVEVDEVKNISPNTSNLITGQWALSYLIESMKSLSAHEKVNWIVCNDGIEHLFNSPFLNDRGPQFLSNLILNIQLSKLPSIFISNDTVTALKVADEYYKSVFTKYEGASSESIVNNKIDVNSIMFYDLPELHKDQAVSYMSSNMPYHDKYISSLLKITGGNWLLMNRIISDYKNFEQNVSLGTVQQVLSGSPSLVDDEYFPINQSKDEQVQYLKEEQLKMFIKNLYHDTLNEDVIKFENSMIELLSCPMMQLMKENVKNIVHFKVIVYETIRHLLDKKWMRLKDGVKIDNKVILALMSSNILYYQLATGMLEFKNSLVKYLLRSYIDIEYEALKPVEKIEYKANLLLNQKSLYQDIDKLFV